MSKLEEPDQVVVVMTSADQVDELQRRNALLTAVNAVLMGALRKVQHVTSRNPDEGMAYCPVCEEMEAGHTKDCEIANILQNYQSLAAQFLKDVEEMETAVVEGLARASAFDDKPHQLYTWLHSLAEKYESDPAVKAKIQDLMNKAAGL
jgi:hypothetical protein